MSCVNSIDEKLQGTLFYTKFLFSVQDSLALLQETAQVSMNMSKEIHGLLGLTHYKCLGAQSTFSAYIIEQNMGKKPQNVMNKNLIYIWCNLI